jgi:hypothetical protein
MEKEELEITQKDLVASLTAQQHRRIRLSLDRLKELELRYHAESSNWLVTVFKNSVQTLHHVGTAEHDLLILEASVDYSIDKFVLIAESVG